MDGAQVNQSVPALAGSRQIARNAQVVAQSRPVKQWGYGEAIDDRDAVMRFDEPKMVAILRRHPRICITLLAFTLAVYAPVVGHGFIDFDDPDYIFQNSHVLKGLTWGNVAWAFTTFEAGNWHPLTWLSHMLDVSLFGVEPGMHHLMSALLHAASTLVLFAALTALTSAPRRCAFVAALFAIHPLHVESVAWACERKDVLSGLFSMLVLGAYAGHVQQPTHARSTMITVALALALMAKPMAITLPIVLLLLDFWPLRRLERREQLNALVTEKRLWLLMAAASTALTVVAQYRGGAISTLEGFPLVVRLANAARSYAIYVLQMFWPAQLMVFYPYSIDKTLGWLAVLAIAGLALITALTWRERSSRPHLLMGWLWYLIMLAPTIGILQVGLQSHADRYTYLPSIGVFVALTWEVVDRARCTRVGTRLLPFALTIPVSLALVAWRQVRTWESSASVFHHALAIDPDNWLAHNNLGFVLHSQGNVHDAIFHYQEALRLRPESAEAHNNYAVLLANHQDQFDQAIPHHREAVRLKPNDREFQDNLIKTFVRRAKELLKSERQKEAIALLQETEFIRPASAEIHSLLGSALTQIGALEQAELHLAQTIRLSPNSAAARNNLGALFVREHRFEEALAALHEALRLKPEFAEAKHNLGLVRFAQNQVDQAIEQFRDAIRINPDYADAHHNLGVALERQGKREDAIAAYQAATRLVPMNERYRASLEQAMKNESKHQ